MNLIGKKVLILGGNGYLGNHFASQFVQQQASVIALSRYLKYQTDPDQGTNILKMMLSNGWKAI